MRTLSGLARAAAAGVGIAIALFFATAAPRGQQPRRSTWLDVAVRQARATDRLAVWVYFAEKGPPSAAGTAGPAASPRAVARRARRGTPTATTAFEDRPLAATYVQEVTRLATRVREQSRWLNAVSVEATPAEIEAVAALPFVSRVDIVRRYRRVR